MLGLLMQFAIIKVKFNLEPEKCTYIILIIYIHKLEYYMNIHNMLSISLNIYTK